MALISRPHSQASCWFHFHFKRAFGFLVAIYHKSEIELQNMTRCAGILYLPHRKSQCIYFIFPEDILTESVKSHIISSDIWYNSHISEWELACREWYVGTNVLSPSTAHKLFSLNWISRFLVLANSYTVLSQNKWKKKLSRKPPEEDIVYIYTAKQLYVVQWRAF